MIRSKYVYSKRIKDIFSEENAPHDN